MIVAEKILILGRVQGVGFRPFVYKTALEHAICGQVSNTPEGVLVLAEGEANNFKQFKASLKNAPGDIHQIKANTCEPRGFDRFSIVSSSSEGIRCLHMPVDLKTCDACLTELKDPDNRRYRYPFINCTQCGPLCSSMGRLFDGVSALIGFTGNVSFEGEAAIQLEEWVTATTAESYRKYQTEFRDSGKKDCRWKHSGRFARILNLPRMNAA